MGDGDYPGRVMVVGKRSLLVVAAGRTAAVPASRLRRSFWTVPRRSRRTNREPSCQYWHYGVDIQPNCDRAELPGVAVVVETIHPVGKDRHRLVEALERSRPTSTEHHRPEEEVEADSRSPTLPWTVANIAFVAYEATSTRVGR